MSICPGRSCAAPGGRAGGRGSRRGCPCRGEVVGLFAVADAAVNDGHLEVGVLAKLWKASSTWRASSRVGSRIRQRRAPVAAEPLDDREGERCRLAGAGLGGADDVPARPGRSGPPGPGSESDRCSPSPASAKARASFRPELREGRVHLRDVDVDRRLGGLAVGVLEIVAGRARGALLAVGAAVAAAHRVPAALKLPDRRGRSGRLARRGCRGLHGPRNPWGNQTRRGPPAGRGLPAGGVRRALHPVAGDRRGLPGCGVAGLPGPGFPAWVQGAFASRGPVAGRRRVSCAYPQAQYSCAVWRSVVVTSVKGEASFATPRFAIQEGGGQRGGYLKLSESPWRMGPFRTGLRVGPRGPRGRSAVRRLRVSATGGFKTGIGVVQYHGLQRSFRTGIGVA